MIRVLLLTPSVRLLGARQSLLELVTHLPPDIQPLVVCPGRGDLAHELENRGVPVASIPHGAWRKLGGWIVARTRQVPALRRLIGRFHPHVVHANEFHSSPQAAAALEGGGPPLVGHIRLSITHRQARNYRMADCRRIVAVSQACARLLDGTGLEDRVRVVYNGVDLSRFAKGSAPRTLRESLGWGAEDLVVGLLGLVSPRKNQMVAAEAVARARAAGVPARLLLAGDAFRGTVEYGEQLRARIGQPDLAGAVHWVPFQRDVMPLYGACDANLLISGEEGFGRTIIEAGALGVPSIGARTGGIPELIREGSTGWLVDEGNVEQLADALAQAHRDRGQLRAMGDASCEHVLRHFSIEAHVSNMIAVWSEAIEAAKGTPREA